MDRVHYTVDIRGENRPGLFHRFTTTADASRYAGIGDNEVERCIFIGFYEPFRDVCFIGNIADMGMAFGTLLLAF